jgi:hypothetical protein
MEVLSPIEWEIPRPNPVLWGQDIDGIPESAGSRFVQALLITLGGRIDAITSPTPLRNTVDDWGVEGDEIEGPVEDIGEDEEEEFLENDPKVHMFLILSCLISLPYY